jgi:glyoxylase-like metal-dependent hydrolase (beta-lactamase superfamily II)
MRRTFARVLAVLAAGAVLVALWAWARIGRIDAERVTPDVWMLTGVGGNVGVLVTGAGVVVVDSMTFARQGDVIEKKVAELTDQPIVAVLNTHYHPDHTHGNPGFAPGTKVVSTANTLKHLKERDADYWRDPPARDLLPNDTFTDAKELKIGTKTIRASYHGRGHTDGDLVVLFVEDRVLQTGDLAWNGHWPNIDLEAGASVRLWPATLEPVIALEYDKVIPGHGPLTDREGVRRFREFLTALWAQTSDVASKGGTIDDALKTVDLDRFGMQRLWFVWFLTRDFVIRRTFEEIAAGRPS